MSTSIAVIIPVKDFAKAKVRLAAELTPGERATLARSMATTVVAAASPLPAHVVCDTDEVRAWAHSVGAEVLWTPGLGLNGAVAAGVERLDGLGTERVIVAHADLPLATELEWVGGFDGVTLVPDRRLDGTNVLAVPTGAGFEFHYGSGSFRAHLDEAARRDLDVRVVRDEALALDVDLPADLAALP